MSGTTTRTMLAAYMSMAEPVMFLSGLFQSPRQNFHASEEVEIDIVRSDEEVSIVIEDLSTGHRMNSADLYTNKGFKPPIHKEAIPLNAFDLIKRQAGQDPFQSPDFRANLVQQMFVGMQKIERKVRRSMEWQASQVLQTGTIDLINAAGDTLYALDFKPKTSHFPTVGTLWNAGGANPIGDLKTLSETIRNDGLENPDQLLFGCDAWEAFISNTEVQARFDNRRIDQGTLSGLEPRAGANYRGTVTIGNYKFDCFTYGGRFVNPQTRLKEQFLNPSKVVMRSSTGRLDATFGAIPNIGKLLQGGGSLLPELPGRVTNAQGGMDLFTNVWMTPDGEQLFGGVGARPLMIPTAIDTFGCATVL